MEVVTCTGNLLADLLGVVGIGRDVLGSDRVSDQMIECPTCGAGHYASRYARSPEGAIVLTALNLGHLVLHAVDQDRLWRRVNHGQRGRIFALTRIAPLA